MHFLFEVFGWCIPASPYQRSMFSLPGSHGNGLWKQQGKVSSGYYDRPHLFDQQGIHCFCCSIFLSLFQEPSLFAVAKLLETGLVNMDRIEILWRPITGHLLEVIFIKNCIPQSVDKKLCSKTPHFIGERWTNSRSNSNILVVSLYFIVLVALWSDIISSGTISVPRMTC